MILLDVLIEYFKKHYSAVIETASEIEEADNSEEVKDILDNYFLAEYTMTVKLLDYLTQTRKLERNLKECLT